MNSAANELRMWHRERVRAIYPPDVAAELEQGCEDWLAKNKLEDDE